MYVTLFSAPAPVCHTMWSLLSDPGLHLQHITSQPPDTGEVIQRLSEVLRPEHRPEHGGLQAELGGVEGEDQRPAPRPVRRLLLQIQLDNNLVRMVRCQNYTPTPSSSVCLFY